MPSFGCWIKVCALHNWSADFSRELLHNHPAMCGMELVDFTCSSVLLLTPNSQESFLNLSNYYEKAVYFFRSFSKVKIPRRMQHMLNYGRHNNK